MGGSERHNKLMLYIQLQHAGLERIVNVFSSFVASFQVNIHDGMALSLWDWEQEAPGPPEKKASDPCM